MNGPAEPAPVWSVELSASSAADTQALASRIGTVLQAGDLLVLAGELGAGKTTFTQGLGQGLGVRPGIISPTFVLVRSHPSLGGGPDLVHVDAYRLGSDAEIDDIDLENTADSAVTVVEWGRGRVEHLSDSWLDITFERSTGAPAAAGPERAGFTADFDEADQDEPRVIRIAAYGPRWEGRPLF
ncbi:tRNA (adenosine(37)-N6)-threonylcarbamoyltransferase complex ATPase subunit type 1 TsaE [Arthrobacter sp. I2-34]|uniref:tRNA threonylcarbamoyladenosine biosynthesis protein TsaE n=1 Tax=Arthrobacter hankyongi TaxID=2904801 RepID=A0ABS9L4W1_9MICC|nr:tRNA (adenosine(37)-N6)-threonylcarbamoyltransferase complex ATPase subunit type 1 TsaE [Arthrobacter hankyongi]MCG2621701.1 tRNA (adenosine(37)-N6)-threonylcarbamoyltransferase complex ATPase subunit type 1 TsaE [Arthrobacter hankyongi]